MLACASYVDLPPNRGKQHPEYAAGLAYSPVHPVTNGRTNLDETLYHRHYPSTQIACCSYLNKGAVSSLEQYNAMFPNNMKTVEHPHPSSVENDQHFPDLDPGLDIKRDRALLRQSQQTSRSGQGILSPHYGQGQNLGSQGYFELSSPFSHYPTETASNWQLQPSFSSWNADNFLASVSPSTQHQASIQHSFPQNPHTSLPLQDTDEFQRNSDRLEGFTYPIAQHDSTAYTMSVQPHVGYGTPIGDIGSSGWMTQKTSPDWLHANYHHGLPARLLTTMTDQSGWQGMVGSPEALHSQEITSTNVTAPLRRKPQMQSTSSGKSTPRIPSPAKKRVSSLGHSKQMLLSREQQPHDNYQLQLPLPPLTPSAQTEVLQLATLTPSSGSDIDMSKPSRSCSSTPHGVNYQSSPPPSDFSSVTVPYLIPIKQSPTFHGDLYTPLYKRRASNGRWEGWCGYCQPGRWLDLKNSRYWEDKLRNHGICAKTKLKFAEPIDFRWSKVDGASREEDDLASDFSDTPTEQKKKEGLCGVCRTWVPIGGLRTKARDRAVGWWMHAYKCHDHNEPPSTQGNTF